jgi:hypothetical protein
VASKSGEKRDLFGGDRKGDEESSRRDRILQTKEFDEELDDIDRDLDQLRALFELYFMGIEKTEPKSQHDHLRARLRKVRETKMRLNTALKFKMQTLQGRMISLETYWGRIMRARENGTYHRDVQKARRRQQELDKKQAAATVHGDALPPENQAKMGEANGESVAEGELRPGAQDAATRGVGPREVSGNTPTGGVSRPKVRSAEDLDEPKMRQLYQTYVTAKRRCGERVDLRFEDMAASLKKQVPKLLQSTGASSIEFKVVIKKGSAVLKAIPRTK